MIYQFFDINTIMITIGNYPLSYIECIATVLNILCVRLVARNKIINWPIGIVAVSLFMILFYQIELYSDMIEQIYFIITGFYGWRLWSSLGKGSTQGNNLLITKISTKESTYYFLGIVLGTILLMYISTHLHVRFPSIFNNSASFPFLDAFTTILSFAATIMMAHKKITCWYLWILVDIIAIGLYSIKGVKFIALEYVLFLMLAVRGLWKRYIIQQNQKNTTYELL